MTLYFIVLEMRPPTGQLKVNVRVVSAVSVSERVSLATRSDVASDASFQVPLTSAVPSNGMKGVRPAMSSRIDGLFSALVNGLALTRPI